MYINYTSIKKWGRGEITVLLDLSVKITPAFSVRIKVSNHEPFTQVAAILLMDTRLLHPVVCALLNLFPRKILVMPQL